MSIQDRLVATGKKKMLSLDGGGIRGVITLEILTAIEKIVQQGNPKLVLADYFDYIAGTSTGAIIATCLSLGMTVADVKKFYVDSGPAMFDRASILDRFRYKFKDEQLSEKLRDILGADTTLGTDKLRTLLLLVLRNATTDSPWPLSNNPQAMYKVNLNLPLWQLVRASTAAPTYFPPEAVRLCDRAGKELDFLFVDGGVTMYNNPAFQLFMMATVEPYNVRWKAGLDDMLIVSVGTGFNREANANLQPGQMNLIYNASSIPSALMLAALNEQDFLCRTFGDCRFGHIVNREIGDMIGKSGPTSPKLFSYLRYNVELTSTSLTACNLPDIKPENVQQLDSVEHIPDLERVGQAIAAQVTPKHFDGFL
jgi:patatin-like phospholipase/acyl hydrolase